MTTVLFTLLTALLVVAAWFVKQTAPPDTKGAWKYWVRNLPTRVRGWKAELYHWLGIGCLAELSLTIIRADGTVEPLGAVSRRVVTNNGVGFIVDAFQNLTELENMNFHAVGTNATAEAASDSALGTEVETRASGTQTEPSSNQYRTTATISITATRALTEHGLLSASSAGVLFDRSVFSTINLVNGESIQCQYTLTLTAGG